VATSVSETASPGSAAAPEGHAPRGSLIGRLTSSSSLIGRIADLLMLLGVVLAPNAGLAIGGRLGFGFVDLVLGFAAIARGFHLIIEGIPIGGLRRQSFLLGLLSVFSVSAVVSSLVIDGPPLILITVIVATLGTGLLVATFGKGGVVEPERDLLRLAQALGVGVAILAISCFLGPKSVEGRAIGFAIHPNALGHSCVMGVAVAVWLWDNAKTTRGRRGWAFVALLNVAAVMQSGSRGGLLALAVGVVAYLALRGNLRLRLAAIAGAWLMVFVVVAGIIRIPAENPIQRLVSSSPSSQYSNEARRGLLEEDLENIGEAPVFGKGYDTVVDVHVVYFQGWIGGGAVDGFILMLLGTTMLLLPLWQRPRDLALAAGAAGIAVAWLFTNILTARDQWIFVALAFATARSISVLRPDRR
jgi:hypothetical protein